MAYKIAFFGAKPYDIASFDKINERYEFDIRYYKGHLNINNVVLTQGVDAVCIFVNDTADAAVIDALVANGVKLLALRCAGFNNVDLNAARGKLPVVRVPAYSPYAVAEYTLALMLSLNRKIHRAYWRTRDGNFSLNGLMGFDMHGKTAGIIGTGKIAKILIHILKGLGMRVLANDLYPDEKFAKEEGITYVSLDELYKESDIISLHCPLTDQTRYLINDDVITGQELCLALFDQGILEYNEEDISQLKATGDAYAFLMKKISTLEITPAQLALAPCNAGVVVTDIKTGEVLALVSYPGYDNNRIGDSAYFSQLQNDLSLPLYNNATQAKKAPGSTFKPLTAVAALEENAIGIEDTIDCTGRYEEIDTPIKCWIYPGRHGPLNMVGGLQNSCNFFFADLGHRLSMDADGNYVPSLGLDKLHKYAALFGLDHKSGVEIDELEPQISDIDPERSAMGQGNHAYTNVQLSRYVAAIASRGNVFELSLLDKTTDSEGNLIKDYTPEISSHIDAADSTWDTVQQGMREVIASGTAKKLFADLEVPIAGKTGTAQEAKNKPNHAFFISYAPYNNPEICVTVNIPFGYSASNAANIAKSVYQYYYGEIDLESILSAGARDAANVTIRD